MQTTFVRATTAPAAAGPMQPFERQDRTDRLALAIARGDAASARRLLRQADAGTRKARLRWLAASYLTRYDTLDGLRYGLVRTLVEEGGLDMAGQTGSELLQLAVSLGPADAALQPRRRAKQLALAQLAVGHGADARAVLLGACRDCNAEPAFLALLLGAGADINASRPDTPALFDRVIETDDLDAAERLIRLGADPRSGACCRRRDSARASLDTVRR
jgi:hypothetical protein